MCGCWRGPPAIAATLPNLPVEIAVGTLEDAASLARAVAGCRYLFHVAADYRLWVPDPAAMYRANVDGTRELMRAALAAGVERIVYTSSVATLGIVAGGSADEITPSRLGDMIGPYKRSKFLAEEAVRGMIAEHGLPVVIVNPSTPIGPARCEADADRAADPRSRTRSYAGLCRYRAQRRACRRCRRRRAACGRTGAGSASATFSAARTCRWPRSLRMSRTPRAGARRDSKSLTRSRSRPRHSVQQWRESPGASRLRRSTVFGCRAKRCISHRRRPSANLVTNRGRRAKPSRCSRLVRRQRLLESVSYDGNADRSVDLILGSGRRRR